MAASKGNQPINNFVKGLITEVSPLSFPENASLDEVNFKLKHDGSRERRLGINYEDGYTEYTHDLSLNELPSATQSAFRWPNPNGSTIVDIGVIQLGRWIYFVNLLTAAPSSNLLNGGAGIDTGIGNESPWQFAVLNNYLLAVNGKLPQPYLVSYNDVTDVISYETAPIMIRDLYGVDDSLGVSERSNTLTEKHKYNLRNQGWSSNIVSTCGTDAIDCTFSTFNVYPSNSDQWGIGRIGDLTDANVDKYDPNIAARNIVDGGQVPRGTYIIDLYNRGRDRNTRTGLTVPLDRETTYVSTVAAYAGRAWYSGIRGKVEDGDNRSPNLANAVLYSQIFRSKTDLVKCFQEADPTSYQFNEVVDTDGGIIHIPEAGNISRIVPIKHSMFVFAENGIWEIRGDEGGFRATSFQVNKISGVGVYSPESIVEANGVIYFWGISGVYAVTPNPQLANVWDTTNITMDSIQRLYNYLPDITKKGAKGYYDLNSNTARWLYTSDNPKIVGNPIDETPPTPLEIGTPITVSVTGLAVDVVVMDATRYALAIYTSAAANDLKVVICEVDPSGTTVVEKTVTTIDTGSKTWDNSIAIEKFTDDKFVVFAQNTAAAPDEIYGIVCTLNADSTVSYTAPQLVANTVSNLNVYIRCLRASSSEVILGYRDSALFLGAYFPISCNVITLGASDVLTSGTKAVITDNTGQDFDIVDSYVANQYVVHDLDRNMGAIAGGSPETRLVEFTKSGTTLTRVGATTDNTNLTTTSVAHDVSTIPGSSTRFVTKGGGTVAAEVLSIMDLSTGTRVYTRDSTKTLAEIGSVNGGEIVASLSASGVIRIVSAYTTSTQGTSGVCRVELEIYIYSGGVLTTQQIDTIDTQANSFYSLRVGGSGFSSTKAPLAYIATTNTVKTLVYELGSV